MYDFDTDIRGAITGCSLFFHGKNVLLCCFYNPPPDSPYFIEMERVTSIFAQILSLTEFDSFIICGYFNLKDCDRCDYSSDDKPTQEFLDLLVE